MPCTHQKGFSLLNVLFFLVVLLGLFAVLVPSILHSSPEGPRIKAIANAKSVAAGLTSFKDEHGSYPLRPAKK